MPDAPTAMSKSPVKRPMKIADNVGLKSRKIPRKIAKIAELRKRLAS